MLLVYIFRLFALNLKGRSTTGIKSSSGISCSSHTVPNVTMRTPPKNLTTGSSFEKDETAIAHPIHKAERERWSNTRRNGNAKPSWTAHRCFVKDSVKGYQSTVTAKSPMMVRSEVRQALLLSGLADKLRFVLQGEEIIIVVVIIIVNGWIFQYRLEKHKNRALGS